MRSCFFSPGHLPSELNFALSGVATYDVFRQSHPVTHRSDYMRGGQYSLHEEHIENREEEMKRTFLQRGALTAFAVLADFFPESLDELQRVALLTSIRDVLGMLPGFSTRESSVQRLSFVLASPLEAYELKSETDRLYAHALFALKDSALGIIQSSSAAGVNELLNGARDNRRHLVQDMRNGNLAALVILQTLQETSDQGYNGIEVKVTSQGAARKGNQDTCTSRT